MVNQIIGIIVLFLTHNVTVYSIIILTIISESICLAVRLVALISGLKARSSNKEKCQ